MGANNKCRLSSSSLGAPRGVRRSLTAVNFSTKLSLATSLSKSTSKVNLTRFILPLSVAITIVYYAHGRSRFSIHVRSIQQTFWFCDSLCGGFRYWHANGAIFINPRRACAARVTVVVLVSVSLCVFDYSRTTGYEAACERYQQLQCYKGKKNNVAILLKRLRSRDMA